MRTFWLDILLFNIYIFILVSFVKCKVETREMYSKSTIKKKATIWTLGLAFSLRYTYLLTLVGIFFIGFSSVNVINLLYACIFLTFFTLGKNVMTTKKGNSSIQTLTTFSMKYWPIIIYFTLGCITAKYIYFLFFDGKYAI